MGLFDEKCRTCLSEITIFDNNITQNYLDLVNKCLPNLSNALIINDVICSECSRCLSDFELFLKKVQEVDNQIPKYAPPLGLSITQYLQDFTANQEPLSPELTPLSLKMQEKDNYIITKKKLMKGTPILTISDLNQNENEHKNELKSDHCYYRKPRIKIDSNITFNSNIYVNKFVSMTMEKDDKMFEVLMGNFKEEGISINDRSTSTTGKKRIILIATNRCTASYNCEKCDRQFLVRYQYKNHREKCKGTITTKCYICHQNLKHRNLLKQHILEVHHYCIKCQKTFPDTEHSQMHNNLICTRRYKCSVCDMKFQSSVHLRRHKKAKHDEIPPLEPQRLCEICGKEFDSVSNLRAHKQIHGDPIKCKICDRVLKNVLTLKQHMRLSHRQKGGPKSQCEHCGRVFWLPSELNRHVAQVHNGEERERKHACPMCDKKFYTKGSVRQHVKFKHISAPVASCEICQKDFPKRAYYEKHMEKHVRDNNEPRKCEICDREFASRLGLSKHLTTHGFSSGRKRRFKCSVCNLAFQLKISLIRHEKMHTETYKYRCNICYVKRFKTEEELRLHESQHRGPKNYKCQICGEAFSRTFILSNHMLNVHDMDDFLLQKSEILAKMKQVKNEQEEERDHPLVVEEDQLVDYQEVTSKTKIGHGGTDLPTLRFRNEEGVIYKLF